VSVSADPGVATLPRLEPGEEFTLTLRVRADFPKSTTGFSIEPPADRAPYGIGLTCDDKRVERWLERSLDDVLALQLAVGDDRYLGAGPPWYLTLFGRDSLISSGMLIPVDPGLAAGTLRALAARQGTKVDPESAEQPGKIPHELRAEVADHGGGLVLPAAVLRNARRDPALDHHAA
jgi:glycogen debranching enzyme